MNSSQTFLTTAATLGLVTMKHKDSLQIINK